MSVSDCHRQALATVGSTCSKALLVDLDAVAGNYRRMQARSHARLAAVVKADAYGLGASTVAQVLWREGCDSYFVASLAEGEELRQSLPEATIYVLGPTEYLPEPKLSSASLIRVIDSDTHLREIVRHWRSSSHAPLPSALHVDTGMNRTGVSIEQLESVISTFPGDLSQLVRLLISHLACADDPAHPKNREQLERFARISRQLTGCPASLCNSAGLWLLDEYHYDLARVGIGLSGPFSVASARDLTPAVSLYGRVLQVRTAKRGDTVGYGAAHTLAHDATLAVIGLGYADGLIRSAPAGAFFHQGRPLPICGHVSMDLTIVDCSAIQDNVPQPGTWVEAFGPHRSAYSVAQAAGTIPNELLTKLGRRVTRVYLGAT